MSIIQSIISEIEQEAESTKTILKRVPVDKSDWKPHEKSMTLKRLATHIAQLSEWPGYVIKTEYLDFADNSIETPEINSTEDLLQVLEKGTENSIKALSNAKDEDLQKPWGLRNGAQILFDMPKENVIRGMSMNHLYHHRGQLSVYLRLLDIPVPGMYGPSADEK